MKTISLINPEGRTAVGFRSVTADPVLWTGIAEGKELVMVQKPWGTEYRFLNAEQEELPALVHFMRAAEQMEFAKRLYLQKTHAETISAMNWDTKRIKELYLKALNAAWYSMRILNRACVAQGYGYLVKNLKEYEDTEFGYDELRVLAVNELAEQIDNEQSALDIIRKTGKLPNGKTFEEAAAL